MSHVRTQIRKAVAAALQVIPSIDGRAFPSRVYPHEELPAIGIYTREEVTLDERLAMGPDRFALARALSLIVEARAMGPTVTHATAERFDDLIDQITAEVEPVMATDETWGGLAQSTDYLGTEFEFDDELEQPLAIARINYRIVYQASTTDPTTAS